MPLAICLSLPHDSLFAWHWTSSEEADAKREVDKDLDEHAEEEGVESCEGSKWWRSLAWEAPGPNTDFWNCGPDSAKKNAEPLKLRFKPRREKLPIDDSRAEIISSIRAHPVVFVSAPTGSGKSTRIPQMLQEEDENCCSFSQGGGRW